MYKKQEPCSEYTLSVIWKHGDVWVFIGGGPLGSGPTGPGSGFSVMPFLIANFTVFHS